MMFRPRIRLATACVCLGLLSGCANLFAKQAIERFALSMQEQSFEELKAATSEGFEEKALRRPEAVKDLKRLRMPNGEIDIVSVEEIDKRTRKAVVRVGEKEKAEELEYILTTDGETGRWVVDDVILSQDSGLGDQIQRSVTDQMDLLLTCREFLAVWKEGSRSDKLRFCDDPLKTELEKLPPKWFSRLSRDIVGSGRQRSFRPEARLNGEKAVVVVPHPDGSLFLELKQLDDHWMISDLAVEPKSKDSTGIRSLSKMTRALNQSASFLTSYISANREGLSKVASQTFYKNCLAAADLEDMPLPVPALIADEYEAKQFTDRIELLLDTDETTYMLTIRPEEPVNSDGTKGSLEPRIDEVTLFSKDGSEVKRLSAVFLSHAVVNLYLDALIQRDVQRLQELSTSDFNERVWNQPPAKHFVILPYPDLQPTEPEIISTSFRGEITEVTIAVGETPMTFSLHHGRGWLVVDDLIMPALDRPTSLKANLELLLPLYAFASAAHQRDRAGLIKESADGLDRIVWLQLQEVPPLIQQLARPIMGEVVSIKQGEPWTLVRTDDGVNSADITLVREGDRYVVHDVTLIPQSQPDNKMELMQTMRQFIADGQRGQTPAIVPASEATSGYDIDQDNNVNQAVFEPIESSLYSR